MSSLFTQGETPIPNGATQNLVESPSAGMRLRTSRVTRWSDEKIIPRSAAADYPEIEKSFRRIMGYESLWVLESALSEEQNASGDPPTATNPAENDATAVRQSVEAEPTPCQQWPDEVESDGESPLTSHYLRDRLRRSFFYCKDGSWRQVS